MSTDNTHRGELKQLQAKLERLEQQDFGKRLDELQKSTGRLEQAHHAETRESKRENHKLAVRLSMLQGVAAVLFAVLSGVVLYYVDRYHKEAEQKDQLGKLYQQKEQVRGEAYEVLLDLLQDKLGDTLDRISLFAPTEEDKTLVTELDELRLKLSRLVADSEKFDALSELTNALKLIVNEGKAKEARALLDRKALVVSKDRFVASRALVLQAMTLIQPNQLCNDPERIKALVSGAIQRDSGVAAAFNLLGVCLAEESRTLMHEQPERWQRSGEAIQAALRNNELAYQFKPTQWSRARLLNNRVWETSQFLLGALAHGRVKESLHWTGYKTMEEFFDQSVIDLEECQMLDQRQPAYLETLAELYGFECAFYQSPLHKDERKASEAHEKMIRALSGAIGKGLLRKIGEPGEAEKYFSEDNLLRPLFRDPEDPRTIDSRIRDLIEQRVRPH